MPDQRKTRFGEPNRVFESFLAILDRQGRN